MTDDSGKAVLRTFEAGDGVVAGSYKVVITKSASGGGGSTAGSTGGTTRESYGQSVKKMEETTAAAGKDKSKPDAAPAGDCLPSTPAQSTTSADVRGGNASASSCEHGTEPCLLFQNKTTAAFSAAVFFLPCSSPFSKKSPAEAGILQKTRRSPAASGHDERTICWRWRHGLAQRHAKTPEQWAAGAAACVRFEVEEWDRRPLQPPTFINCRYDANSGLSPLPSVGFESRIQAIRDRPIAGFGYRTERIRGVGAGCRVLTHDSDCLDWPDTSSAGASGSWSGRVALVPPMHAILAQY
jgi:hypothetical protein